MERSCIGLCGRAVSICRCRGVRFRAVMHTYIQTDTQTSTQTYNHAGILTFSHANIHASHSLPLHYTALQHVTLHYKALQIHMDYVTFHGFHYITHYIS